MRRARWSVLRSKTDSVLRITRCDLTETKAGAGNAPSILHIFRQQQPLPPAAFRSGSEELYKQAQHQLPSVLPLAATKSGYSRGFLGDFSPKFAPCNESLNSYAQQNVTHLISAEDLRGNIVVHNATEGTNTERSQKC